MQNEPHAAGGSERSRRPIGLFTALRTATATAARRRTQCIDDLDVDPSNPISAGLWPSIKANMEASYQIQL